MDNLGTCLVEEPLEHCDINEKTIRISYLCRWNHGIKMGYSCKCLVKLL